MAHYVYILQSQKDKKYYIGETVDVAPGSLAPPGNKALQVFFIPHKGYTVINTEYQALYTHIKLRVIVIAPGC